MMGDTGPGMGRRRVFQACCAVWELDRGPVEVRLRRVSGAVLSWRGHNFSSSFRRGERCFFFSSEGDAKEVCWQIEPTLNHEGENS